VKLLPRVQQDIDLFKPGTKIAITEYNFGGSNHISGAIAEADALGIFGREGVFAASLWGLSSQQQYTAAGFKMYLDYDGASGNGKFGDLSITANTDKIADSAVYASLDSTDPTRMVVVAINRSTTDKTTAIEVTSERRFTSAEVYRLAGSATPARQADIPINLVNSFLYTMPGSSVTTFVLHAAPDGDFNNDGFVNAGDVGAWTNGLGLGTGAALGDGDYDGDHDVDGADFLSWQRGFGTTPGSAAAAPEPGGIALALVAIFALAGHRRRGK
jgi:MYXO-CTERM domain-containing protein